MPNMILGGFKLKIAEPKKQKTSSDGYIRVGKLVCGVVVETYGTWKVRIETEKRGVKVQTMFDFTPRSYDLEGRQTVFLRKRDETGRICRIIKDPLKAKFFPGLTEQYVPFANNWVVKGYIVKEGAIKLFDFKDLVGINGYTVAEVDYEG